MNWLGDYPEDFTTVCVYFTTHDSNGAPVAPSSAFESDDVKIYKNGSATQKTSTNGLTMTSPFDSIVGLHCLVIDTSNDTGDSGFWTTGGGGVYSVVLNPDTETVNSQTALKVIGTFGIALAPALRPTVAGRTLDVSSNGEAGVDWNNIGSPTTTVNLSGTTIATTQKVDVETIKTNPVANGGTITFPSNATLASTTNITAGTITTTTNVTTVNGLASGVITAASIATDAIGAAELAADSVTEIAAAVWDEVLTAATHNISSSAGRRLRQITAIVTVDSTVNDASATATSFVTALTNATDDFYNDQLIIFTSGVLSGQARPVLDYVGSTKRITVSETLTSAPGNGDAFTLQATHIHPVTQIAAGAADAIWDEVRADHVTAGTFGEGVSSVQGNVTGSVASVTGLTAANLDVAVSTRLASASYTAPANASITAIKAKTDSLTFTIAGNVDSNIQRVNDITVTGAGTSGDPWGP